MNVIYNRKNKEKSTIWGLEKNEQLFFRSFFLCLLIIGHQYACIDTSLYEKRRREKKRTKI